jgi:hypothetical protein
MTVQPVAICYTIYALPPPSHTEGDDIFMAHSRGKNHENYLISLGFF